TGRCARRVPRPRRHARRTRRRAASRLRAAHRRSGLRSATRRCRRRRALGRAGARRSAALAGDARGAALRAARRRACARRPAARASRRARRRRPSRAARGAARHAPPRRPAPRPGGAVDRRFPDHRLRRRAVAPDRGAARAAYALARRRRHAALLRLRATDRSARHAGRAAGAGRRTGGERGGRRMAAADAQRIPGRPCARGRRSGPVPAARPGPGPAATARAREGPVRVALRAAEPARVGRRSAAWPRRSPRPPPNRRARVKDSRRTPAVWPGRPYPRGATWDGEGVNFSIFSEGAERVELCLFDGVGRRETHRIELRERTDNVWHCHLPQARPGLLYGYRVHGPYRPEEGLRFNRNKLLLDPYAKSIAGTVRWHDALFGYTVGDPREDLSFDGRDSAPFAPRARVMETAFSWGADRRPRVAWNETVIYELNVRGFTMLNRLVPEPLRGTYAGLSHLSALEYLKRLGVTTVELMPVHAFVDDRRLVNMGLRNYWGYNTLSYFAPEGRYSASGRIQEFKTMVKALHSAGIEVVIDVVYNHTCEGNHL